MFQAGRKAGSAALAFLLAACSMVDPHSHSPELEGYRYEVDVTPLKSAINAARDQKRRYDSAVSEYSFVDNTAPLVIGGLTLSALLLGATGGGTSALRFGLGGGAAGTFGLSRLYDNQVRQRIWLNGSKALNCAVGAVEPLVAMGGRGLMTDTATVQAKLSILNSLSLANRGNVVWPQDQVVALKTRAAGDIAASTKLLTAIEVAAINLRKKAADIQNAVDVQLVATNPAPEAILDTVRASTSAFAGLLPTTPNSGTSANLAFSGEVPDKVDEAADSLQLAVTILEGDLFPLSTFAGIQASIAGCDVGNLPVVLTVFPNEVVHPAVPPGATWQYVVTGATGTVTAATSLSSKDVTVTTQQQGGTAPGTVGAVVTVTVLATATAPNTGTLQITDSSGQRPWIVQLSISAAAKPASAPPTATTTTTAAPPVVFTGMQLDLVRRNLGPPLKPTGEASLSSAELAKLQSDYAPATSLTATLYKKILLIERAKAAQPVTPEPAADIELAKSQGPSIRQLCGLKPVTAQAQGESDDAYTARVFNDDLHLAIFDTQSTAAPALKLQITGQLDDATVLAIEGSGANKLVCKKTS